MKTYPSVGDRVKILKTGETGIISHNRNSGLFDIRLDAGYEKKCFYSDELQILEETIICRACGKFFLKSQGYFSFPGGDECKKCGDNHWQERAKGWGL